MRALPSFRILAVLSLVLAASSAAFADRPPSDLQVSMAFEEARAAADRLAARHQEASAANPPSEALWEEARKAATEAHARVRTARALLSAGRRARTVGDAMGASLTEGLAQEARRVAGLSRATPAAALPQRDVADPALQRRADERLAKLEKRLEEALAGVAEAWGDRLAKAAEPSLATTRAALEQIRSLRRAAAADPARRGELVAAADRASRFMNQWEMEWSALEASLADALRLSLQVAREPKPRRGGLVGGLDAVSEAISPSQPHLDAAIGRLGGAVPSALSLGD